VITFTDITDRRKREEKINYLSYHDTLTGLYNRQYFTESLAKLDRAENLPLSVIFADINGLKMTNDIFGHAAGDALIKKSSEILVQSCRASDMVARLGGDEFIILLPNTEHEQVKRIITRIRSGFAKIKVEAIKCSLSIGSDTKSKVHEPIEDIIANAENEMYWDKLMHRKEVNRDMIDTIIDTLHSENPEEKQHSEVVSQLCGEMGAAFGMADPEISRLKQAGYLHDIGKIVLDKSSLAEDVDKENMKQHVIGGYRILHLFDDTLDLAEYVYNHHERWDGKGYPKGLKGEEIPKISRIISIAETYERVLRREGGSEGKKKALQVIQDGAGKRFDPQIAELFIQMMEANNE
jgi:diguanylate cyclase (GGDEF)-like protein/putative nucleotidyltransferase with HDIG domain